MPARIAPHAPFALNRLKNSGVHRQVRTLTAAVLAAVAALALSIALAASPGDRSGCDPKRSRTLSETDDARVFVRRVRGTPRMYGCWFDDGRVNLLRSRRVGDDSRVRLAGRYVAYPWYGRSDSVELRVFDLRRGQRFRTAARYANSSQFPIESFVVNDRGSVAWIVVNSQQNPFLSGASVRRYDSEGPAQLDDGDEIVPRSLAIDTDDSTPQGAIIYWLGSGGPSEAQAASLR
jgi:hypothetical protein